MTRLRINVQYHLSTIHTDQTRSSSLYSTRAFRADSTLLRASLFLYNNYICFGTSNITTKALYKAFLSVILVLHRKVWSLVCVYSVNNYKANKLKSESFYVYSSPVFAAIPRLQGIRYASTMQYA